MQVFIYIFYGTLILNKSQKLLVIVLKVFRSRSVSALTTTALKDACFILHMLFNARLFLNRPQNKIQFYFKRYTIIGFMPRCGCTLLISDFSRPTSEWVLPVGVTAKHWFTHANHSDTSQDKLLLCALCSKIDLLWILVGCHWKKKYKHTSWHLYLSMTGVFSSPHVYSLSSKSYCPLASSTTWSSGFTLLETSKTAGSCFPLDQGKLSGQVGPIFRLISSRSNPPLWLIHTCIQINQ